ncbi:MAG: 3-keto-5-aminohexanoate cleavage protein [Solirubrobacteraceae bacterium]
MKAGRVLAQLAIERGGHVRVGLEGCAGGSQPSNAELVGQVVSLAHAARTGRGGLTCSR